MIRNLLAEKAWLPRAIVCANDQTALGVMYELAKHGIDVPGEIAVTGFDDMPVARHLRPQLTTVRQPIQELGAIAFDMLRSMISSNEPDRARGRAADQAGPPRKLRLPSAGDPRTGREKMMRLITRRIVLYLLTALVAITVNFFIPRLMPGNPVEVAIGHMQARVTPATIRALDLQYGINTKLGLIGQYLHYLNQLIHGNLGISFSFVPGHRRERDPQRAAMDHRAGRDGHDHQLRRSARCSASRRPGGEVAGWTTCCRR